MPSLGLFIKCITLSNFHSNPMRQIFFKVPQFRQVETVSERLSDLPKVTQQISHRAEI